MPMTAAGRLRVSTGSAFLGLALSCAAPLPALAQTGGEDLFGQVAPSIAQLNISGFAARTRCTAVQLGRRAALAFSFCLQAGRFDQAHLLFGYDRGEWGQRRGPVSAFNDPAQPLLKLLCLDRSLPRSRFAARSEPLSKGDPVIVSGYTAAKPETLTFRGCKVQRTVRAGEFYLDCDAGPGSSGSAVFRREHGAAALLGILAAPSPTGSLVLAWNGGNPDDLCPYYRN